jgi:hypothetical protein
LAEIDFGAHGFGVDKAAARQKAGLRVAMAAMARHGRFR